MTKTRAKPADAKYIRVLPAEFPSGEGSGAKNAGDSQQNANRGNDLPSVANLEGSRGVSRRVAGSRGDSDAQPDAQPWRLSHRASPEGNRLAKRHYNCQSPDSNQFVPPGRCLVFLAGQPAAALWVSSWPFAEYTKHAWAGAWMNSCFRNEGAGLSSDLITAAVAATAGVWGDPPPLGFVTFVDAAKTRRKCDPGRCYRRAGWEHVGFTQGGLWAFQLQPDRFPTPHAPEGYQQMLFAGGVA